VNEQDREWNAFHFHHFLLLPFPPFLLLQLFLLQLFLLLLSSPSTSTSPILQPPHKNAGSSIGLAPPLDFDQFSSSLSSPLFPPPTLSRKQFNSFCGREGRGRERRAGGVMFFVLNKYLLCVCEIVSNLKRKQFSSHHSVDVLLADERRHENRPNNKQTNKPIKQQKQQPTQQPKQPKPHY